MPEYKKHITSRSKLYKKTLEFLLNRPDWLTLATISKDTGLPVGWLVSIVAHPDMSPSVDRIERLYNYLSPKPFIIPDDPIVRPLKFVDDPRPSKPIPQPLEDKVCEICGVASYPINGKRLGQDHCHKTNKQRGFLCNNCNAGIGFLKDDPATLQKAIDYLNKYKTQ